MEISQSLQESVSDALEYIQALAVTDQNSLDQANRAMVRIGVIQKGIIDYFSDPKKKAKATHQAIVDKEKEALKPLKEAEEILKPKIRTYVIKQRRIQEEAERKAREEAARIEREAEEKLKKAAELENEGKTKEALDIFDEAAEKIEESKAQVNIPKAPVMSGIHTRTYWKWRIVNALKIPREYLMIDQKALDAEVQRSKGKTDIPGIEVYEETGVARSRGG